MAMNHDSTARSTTKPAPKLLYATPRLVIYGDLRTITENMVTSGSDGLSGTHSKSL